MDNIDHNDYVKFELEIALVNLIRTAKESGINDDTLHDLLDTYLESFN